VGSKEVGTFLWGEAEVLEPVKLRRDVMDELKSAGRKYRGVLKGL